MRMKGLFVAIALVAAPRLASAQHQHPPSDATVDFGVLPTHDGADWSPPLSSAGGGCDRRSGDPCAYMLHVLTPEEVTIQKGGQVTLDSRRRARLCHLEVSPDTTRERAGAVPLRRHGSGRHRGAHKAPVQPVAANANARHVVLEDVTTWCWWRRQMSPTGTPTTACGPKLAA